MKIKKFLQAALVIALLICVCVCAFAASAVSDDPADSYVKRNAEHEDASLSLWFDHSFRKTFTSDTVSTGMDTYSIYMAKNEIESAQFVLYSPADMLNMNVTLSDFTDADGNKVNAEIYYEMYVTTENVATNAVYGMDPGHTIIREGETPDPVMPYSALGTAKKPASFKLNAGKSQAFLIRAKTAEDSVSGWYSAELSVFNGDGQQVKVATVYLYVWDFVIPDEIDFQTSLFVGNDTSYGGTYSDFYDYFLENRMNAMDVPGGQLKSWNPYLTNPRVNAIRVSSTGLGSVSGTTYMEATPSAFKSYENMYDDLSRSPDWEKFKDKLYFYTADEFSSDEHLDDCFGGPQNHAGHTANTVTGNAAAVEQYWENPTTMVTIHLNPPYPYYTYHQPLSSIPDYQKMDNIQRVLNEDAITIWCPQLYAFTPRSELNITGYTQNGVGDGYIMNLNHSISGIYCTGTSYQGYPSNWGYYDWDGVYGEFSDRLASYQAIKKPDNPNVKMWMYRAGGHNLYTYCHHLIESTGLQTKMMFWQCYQEDITGYLYYATNGWLEQNTNAYIDRTVTGAKSTYTWYTNKYVYAGTTDTIYGMGVLFYGRNMGKTTGVDVIGSFRVENMRDGIEEYTMLKMLEDYKGKDRSKEIVAQVSTNVVRYLSLDNFSTAGWDSSMDEYDIFAAVRKNLGNELEEAVNEGLCEHEWDNGQVTEEAGCLTVGAKTYTCTLCGAERSEVIPAAHTAGDCFVKESGTEATCTSDGSAVWRCTVCGYKKTVVTAAFHNDPDKFVYEYKSDSTHTVKCSVCGQVISSADAHRMAFRKASPTCTDDGYEKTACRFCDYEIVESTTPAIGHNYVDGVCENCGEPDPSAQTIPGDLDGDGKVTAKDINLIKKMMTGTIAYLDAADLNGDNKLTVADVNALKKIVTGS